MFRIWSEYIAVSLQFLPSSWNKQINQKVGKKKKEKKQQQKENLKQYTLSAIASHLMHLIQLK